MLTTSIITAGTIAKQISAPPLLPTTYETPAIPRLTPPRSTGASGTTNKPESGGPLL